MKRLLLLPLLVLVVIANAKNYYVAAAGSDNNAGTSVTAPWKSISKVNSFTFAAGDSILFNRGDIFYGSVIVKGNNLNYAAYGTGAKPLISGFTTISAWKSLGNGIYEGAVNAKSNLNMVAINGRPQQIGRYPNASDANGGYLTFEAATASSITDNQLSTTVDWTGAEVAIRKNGWKIDRGVVTSQSGGTINYNIGNTINSGVNAVSSTAKLGHGYFFMDDPRTLDQFGEWYFDPVSKKIQIFFGTAVPAGYTVQVSTVDTLLDINNRTNIKVNNISFEGANMSGIFSLRGGFITIQNCDLVNIGARAIHIYESSDILIENVNTSNVLSNAIQVINKNVGNVTVRNCVAINTAQFAGMGSFFDDSDYKGMYLTSSDNLLIEYNKVDTVGHAGIQFGGNNVTVRNNIVNYFCYIVHDNGGIYTYVGGTDANPGSYYTNRVVSNNIVMNGIGAPLGTSSSAPFLGGIYLDGRTMNVLVSDNTVFNMPKSGIHCNNPSNITIRGNTFYNNGRDMSLMRWAWGSITNLNIKKNVSFPLNNSQNNIYYTNAGLNTPVTTTLQANLKSLGSIDSNYYNSFSDDGMDMEIYDTEGGPLIQTTPFSLDGWRSFTNYDQATKRPAQKIQLYTINSTIGSNLFANSQFTSNINGTTIYGSNTTASWDNTGKISGGSVRVDISVATANKYSILHSPIGPVSSSKKYILRFTTLGTKVNGIVRAYIRKTNSPYNNLVPTQAKSFGLSKTTHEFLFDAPITDAAASFVIELEQTTGTTYIDNVEFVEVNATINSVESQVKLLYNDTKLSKSFSLDAKYIGVDSTVYNGTITLAPYSSKVIVKAGALSSGVLPVKLIDFSAKVIGEKVEAKWVTTGEINSSHYLVERSINGRDFESIGNVASNNYADVQSTYSYIDDKLLEGVLYYRLAMVDKDGSISYSEVVSVNIKNSKSLVIDNVKVSASSSNIRINVSSYHSQMLSFAVIDVNGRIVATKNAQLQTGSNTILTDIPSINKGIYYVKMQTKDVSVTRAVLSD